MRSLIAFNENGIYCPQGDFYIDPWKAVSDAIITHAHADHARVGHAHYLAHEHSKEILYYRLGKEICLQTVKYGETVQKNGVKISLHPAGHVIGSAQVRLEYKGQVCVVSGDYKTEDDGICPGFEPLRCHEFLTESTFGLPVYRWQQQAIIFEQINHWWQENRKEGYTSVILAYALGKSQRILRGVAASIGNIFVHTAVWNTLEALSLHFKLSFPIQRIEATVPKEKWKGALIVAPPSVENSIWLRRFEPYRLAVASGWMSIRGIKRRRAIDRGFVLSDHADWQGLLAAVRATGAEKVYVTHGYTDAFSRYLTEIGISAVPTKTFFEGEVMD